MCINLQVFKWLSPLSQSPVLIGRGTLLGCSGTECSRGQGQRSAWDSHWENELGMGVTETGPERAGAVWCWQGYVWIQAEIASSFSKMAFACIVDGHKMGGGHLVIFKVQNNSNSHFFCCFNTIYIIAFLFPSSQQLRPGPQQVWNIDEPVHLCVHMLSSITLELWNFKNNGPP